jgi:4-nitrophenyl phosphatase
MPNSTASILSGLRSLQAVLFDMDGVIYVGNRVLPGVQTLLDYLEQSGRKWLFVTNNASLTSHQFAEKLAKMGVRAHPYQIFGSAEATAAWLAEQVAMHGWPHGKAIVMGQDGLRTALQTYGFELTSDPHAAAYAVAGINFNLTYNDLADVTLAIRHGARFVGTNPDLTYPTERGQTPGAGSILALLAAASGVQPQIIGKPYPGMYEQAMHRLGATPAVTLMVGDRYDTDISGAIKLGLWSAGILTGISKRSDFEYADPPPQLIIDDLLMLLRLFEEADR